MDENSGRRRSLCWASVEAGDQSDDGGRHSGGLEWRPSLQPVPPTHTIRRYNDKLVQLIWLLLFEQHQQFQRFKHSERIL